MPSYKLIRSKRSTLSLQIDDSARLVVRAPLYISKRYIENFINEKEKWIKQKQFLTSKRIRENERFKLLLNKKTILSVKKRAKRQLYDRLVELSEKHDYPFAKMRLSGAKTRWGSCSYKNTISLNWKVMLAPPRVIDYLIIHELVHTKYKNHQRNFWNAVAKIHPTFKEDRVWLKTNAHLLSIDT